MIRDNKIIKKELNQAIALALHGIHLGYARLDAKNNDTKNINNETKTALINELTPIIENHKKTWLLRNRPGGLEDSAGKMEDLLNYYKTKTGL